MSIQVLQPYINIGIDAALNRRILKKSLRIGNFTCSVNPGDGTLNIETVEFCCLKNSMYHP